MPLDDDRPLVAWDQLYDEAACGLLLTDADGTISLANATFCRLVGIERDALVGKRRFQDLLTMGGRIFHQTHWAPLLQMQGSVVEVKLDLVRAGAAPLPMVMNALRRERAGKTFHELALFVAEDRHTYERELMQARKRAESLLEEQKRARDALALAEMRLRTALEAGSLHVWETDLDTGERHFDPGVALLMGRDAPGEVDFQDYRDAVEPADLVPTLAAFSQMLVDPDRAYRATYRLNGADGVQRTVLATARPVVATDGSTRRIVGVLQDITELSAQRAAAEDRALFAEQMIGIVSHDLRNPLSTIRMGGQVLQMSGLPEKQRGVLANISRATQRALRMINDLLDFTRARIGTGLGVEIQPMDLHACVAAQVDELALAYPTRSIVHRREGAGNSAADADRLAQVVGNLVSNAVAYGDPDRPVTVTSRIAPDQCTVVVHNLGPVIPPERYAALFQPMVRGAGGDAASRSVGLGLYIVAEIARAHGGSVEIESSAEGGTEFTVRLPSEVSVRSNCP